jgi:hypothetical protein
VPTYAAVLMGLGGTFALVMSIFALSDAILSWHNLTHLRDERKRLHSCRKSCEDEAFLDARLEVNVRETWLEVIDRLAMDAFMGFGAVLIGVGTLMAIGGANPHVYLASNLMSGFIGNSPPAIWGLANTLWCCYLWRRASRHLAAGSNVLNTEILTKVLKPRIRLAKLHTLLMGVTTLVSGAASLVTAKWWWGYPVLIPCIVIFVYDNHLLRQKLGYERSTTGPEHGEYSAVQELEWVVFEGKTLVQTQVSAEHSPQSIDSALSSIIRCDLFEEFSIRLLEDTAFTNHALQLSRSEGWFASEGVENGLTMTPQIIVAANDQYSAFIIQTAESCIRDVGVRQMRWRERYLLELVGSYLCVLEQRQHSAARNPSLMINL